MNLLTLVEAMHGDDSGDNPTVTPQAQGVGNPQLQLRQTLTTAQSDTELDRSTVEDIVKKPALLVGKKIRHRFEVGNELLWFIGTVLSVDLKTKEFQVSYEGESYVCCFTLLDDILCGDLELLYYVLDTCGL